MCEINKDIFFYGAVKGNGVVAKLLFLISVYEFPLLL